MLFRVELAALATGEGGNRDVDASGNARNIRGLVAVSPVIDDDIVIGCSFRKLKDVPASPILFA